MLPLFDASEKLRARCHADLQKAIEAAFQKYGIKRDKLQAFEAACRKADSGAFAVQGDQIIKHGSRTPVKSPDTLAFMAQAVDIVPTLLRAFYALETAYLDAVAAAISARADKARAEAALEKHREEIARKAVTGPAYELGMLALCLRMVEHPETLEPLIRRWAMGHSVESEIRERYECAAKKLIENAALIEAARRIVAESRG